MTMGPWPEGAGGGAGPAAQPEVASGDGERGSWCWR